MIVRDEYGIIVQHRPYDISYIDGGDSARGSGIVALFGSELDQKIISKFVTEDGLGMRHPYQVPHNDTRSFTRDQLLPLMAGLSTIDSKVARKLLWSHARRLFLCQNTHDQEGNLKPWWRSRDILHPGHIGFMIQASKLVWLYPLLVFCWPFLLLEVLFHTHITPTRESNQILSMMVVSGNMWIKLFCYLNKDWRHYLIDYWGSWRNQPEIAFYIIENIDKIVLKK